MKLPEHEELKDLASYYGIKSRGKLKLWVSQINPNAAIHYYKDGEWKHMRAVTILKIIKYY